MAKEPTVLSTLLKGIAKGATHPLTAALEFLLESKPTNVGEQEWLEEQREAGEMAYGNAPASWAPSPHKITSVDESKKKDSSRTIRNLEQNLPSFKKGLSSLIIDEEIFKNVLKREDGTPVVIYRGSHIGPTDPPEKHKGILKGEGREDYATFLSDNPSVAESYTGPSIEGSRFVDEATHSGGVIVPYLIKPKKVIEYEDRYMLKRKVEPGYGISFDKFEFDRRAKNLKKGEVLIARDVHDAGPWTQPRQDTKGDDALYWSYGSDLYATKDPSILISAISKKKKGGGSVMMRNPYGYSPRAI